MIGVGVAAAGVAAISSAGDGLQLQGAPAACKGVVLYSLLTPDPATLYPMVEGQMDVTIHCQEGGRLVVRMNQNVSLKRVNGQFLVTGASLFRTPGGTSVMEK